MDTEEKSLRNKIVFVSFVLSILVIYIHANTLVYYSVGENTVGITYKIEKFFMDICGQYAVPMFFLISGFLFFKNIDIHQKEHWKIIFEKQKKRIQTILVPYLLWNLFGTIFYMFIPRIPVVSLFMNNEAADISIKNIFEGVFCYKYYTHLWYLATLMLFIILAPIISILLRKLWISFAIEYVTVCVLIINPDWNSTIIDINGFYYFFLGAILAVYGKKFMMQVFTRKHSCLCLLICTLMLISQGTNMFGELSGIAKWLGLVLFPLVALMVFERNIAFFCIGLLALVLALCGMGVNMVVGYIFPIFLWKAFDIFPSHEPKEYEKQSFFIYCTHPIVIATVNHIFLKLGGVGASDIFVIVSFLVAPVISLGIIYIGYKFLSTYFEHFYSLITGGRSNR